MFCQAFIKFISRTIRNNRYTKSIEGGIKMFYTNTKNYQTKHLAKTWQNALQKREIEKNNYHVTGDIKKAKAFVRMVENFTFKTDDFTQLVEKTIFSNDLLTIPISPLYLFANF
jgi:hypothetical protein